MKVVLCYIVSSSVQYLVANPPSQLRRKRTGPMHTRMGGGVMNENCGAIDHPPPPQRRSSSNDTFISASINGKSKNLNQKAFFFLFKTTFRCASSFQRERTLRHMLYAVYNVLDVNNVSMLLAY